ncbi:fatty-acyl-CoA synthase [Rhizobiales bacterium GAS113]|nr:fatty-acyl-CoA synthase [Rhizobiales bacterium GAS113]SEE53996.1 fatty-acyl-CoA synthase [Rhizobiales bacterium GAS188]
MTVVEEALAKQKRIDESAKGLVDEHPRLVDLIARGAQLNPLANAITYMRTATDPDPVSYTHGEFIGLVVAAARWYRARGLAETDAVSILLPTCPAMIVAQWGAAYAAVVQPLNLLFSREAIAAQLRAVGARLLLVPPPGTPGGLYEKVAGLDSEIDDLRLVVLPLDGSVSFDGEMLRPADDWREDLDASKRDGDADRVAALYPTGGTTGVPKIARLSNRNMVASSVGSLLGIDYRPKDRTLLALPLFHVGGSFCTCVPALAAGGAIVVPTPTSVRNPAVIANFWRIAAEQRLSIVGVVPTTLSALADVPVAGADLSHLRLVATGASVLPAEIERRFLSVCPVDAVRQIYGMTELAGGVAQVWFDERPRGLAVGKRCPQVEFAIYADGRLLREWPSPVGELMVRAPHVFRGYVDPRQTEKAFHDGWLRTGDLCRVDEDGQVSIIGRIKDLIIRGGHNIDPCAIEDVAMSFPGVALAAAVGAPDAYAGEVPMLFVSAQPGEDLDAAELASFLQERVLEPPAQPKIVAVLAEMPVTPVGKIYKPRLRELAAEKAAGDLLAATCPQAEAEIAAAHDAERGLLLSVKIEGGPAMREQARRALARFPIPIEISAKESGP